MFRRTLRPSTLKSMSQRYGAPKGSQLMNQARYFSRNLLKKQTNLNQTQARNIAISLNMPIQGQQSQSDAENKANAVRDRAATLKQRVFAKKEARLRTATGSVLDKFISHDFDIKSVEVYVRSAGSFDDEQSKRQEVDIALRGIMHTVVILKTDSGRYLLDRVIEGIRLVNLDENEDKFKREEMVKVNEYSNLSLSSKQVAEWVHYQGTFKYHVAFNNCVYFSAYFYQRFICGQRLVSTMRSGVQAIKQFAF